MSNLPEFVDVMPKLIVKVTSLAPFLCNYLFALHRGIMTTLILTQFLDELGITLMVFILSIHRWPNYFHLNRREVVQ